MRRSPFRHQAAGSVWRPAPSPSISPFDSIARRLYSFINCSIKLAFGREDQVRLRSTTGASGRCPVDDPQQLRAPIPACITAAKGRGLNCRGRMERGGIRGAFERPATIRAPDRENVSRPCMSAYGSIASEENRWPSRRNGQPPSNRCVGSAYSISADRRQ